MTDVRKRLVKALHTSATLPELREELVMIVCDLEDAHAAPTVRSVTDASGHTGHNDEAPDTERDSAPATAADSQLGQEFGL